MTVQVSMVAGIVFVNCNPVDLTRYFSASVYFEVDAASLYLIGLDHLVETEIG